jgi:hypothetical protein
MMANVLMGLALTCGYGLAQSTDSAQRSNAKTGNAPVTVGQEMTVTGCLSQEPKEKKEFVITGEDSRTWGLKSSSVKLADHLNHKVTVTGKVTKKEHEGGHEAGDLNVSNLQMISQTCQ